MLFVFLHTIYMYGRQTKQSQRVIHERRTEEIRNENKWASSRGTVFRA